MEQLTQTQLEDLICEVIRFCQKWGQWREATLYCGGKKYEWCEEDSAFRGFRHVRVTEGIRLEDEDNMALQELRELNAQTGENVVLYLFGALGDLLGGPSVYEAKFSELSKEAQYELMQSEELLGDFDYLDEPRLDPIEFDSYEEYLDLEDEMEAAELERQIAMMKGKIIYREGGAIPEHIKAEFDKLLCRYGLNYSGTWGAVTFWRDERRAAS